MDISRLERMGRRRFMENLAGLGVSGTTLQYLEQDDLSEVTEDPEEEIPYVAAWKNVGRAEDGTVQREPVYDTIPREEWERRQATFNARKQIGEQLQDMPGECKLGITDTESSPTGFAVTVGVSEKQHEVNQEIDQTEVESMLPTELTGKISEVEDEVEFEDIPVKLRSETTALSGGRYSTGSIENQVPAGVSISTTVTGGTLNAPFHSNEYGDGWATAGHVVIEEGGSGDNRVDLRRNSNYIYIGDSRDEHRPENSFDNLDYAFVEALDSKEPSEWIVSPDGSSEEYSIGGIVTDEALSNNVGNEDYEVLGQGSSSGRLSGYIDNIDGWPGIESVKTTFDTSNGDSGGPIFHLDGDTAYIAGIMFKDQATVTESTTAQTVEEELGGYFKSK